VLINDAYNEFIRSREAMACTFHTLETYRHELGPKSMLQRFMAARGAFEIEELTGPVLTEYLAWYRDRGVSANTLASIRIRFGVLMNWCGAMGYCPDGIMQRVPRPRVRQFIRRVHTEDEVKRMIETASDQRLYHPFDGQELTFMLLLLLDTGLRLGEVAALNVGDLDGELIKIRGKGEKDRLIMISEPTRKSLEAYLQLRQPVHPDQPLWLNRGYGRNHHLRGLRVTDRGIYQRIKRLGQQAGIQTSPHRWRHTFAVFAVKNGANLKALQLFLGHSSLQTTDNYLRGFGFQDAAREHKVFSPVQRMVMQH